MDQSTTGVLGILGGLVIAVGAVVVNVMMTRRQVKSSDRKDALDEVYKLYGIVQAENQLLKDKNTALLIEAGDLKRSAAILKIEVKHLRGLPVTPEDLEETGESPGDRTSDRKRGSG